MSAKKKQGHATAACPCGQNALQADELVADTRAHHQGVTEVAHVVRVQVHTSVPLLHLPAGADAHAELPVVLACGSAAARDARHQVEHTELGSAEQPLMIR